MLDGKNASERVPAEVRDQPGGVIPGVRWVRKDEIKRARRQPLGEAHGIAPVDGDRIGDTQRFDVLLQGAE
jgi:hypothetical protein